MESVVILPESARKPIVSWEDVLAGFDRNELEGYLYKAGKLFGVWSKRWCSLDIRTGSLSTASSSKERPKIFASVTEAEIALVKYRNK